MLLRDHEKFIKFKEKYTFDLVVLSIFVISILLAFNLEKSGISLDLNNYSDFIGDVLNFVSIITGFLAALIGIVTVVPDGSLLFKNINQNKKSRRQYYASMLVPFFIGMSNIIVSVYFRMYISNPHMTDFWGWLNKIFLFSFCLFVLSSSLMILMSYKVISISNRENTSQTEDGYEVQSDSFRQE